MIADLRAGRPLFLCRCWLIILTHFVRLSIVAPLASPIRMRCALRVSLLVVLAYRSVGIPSDRLPYSPDIERLRAHLRAAGCNIDLNDLWRIIRDLRKRRLLPCVGRGKNNRSPLPPAEIVLNEYAAINVELDDLPYTCHMDRLVAEVRRQTQQDWAYWQVWWALLDARKSKRRLKFNIPIQHAD